MPKHRAMEYLTPADRRREVASILAKGILRLRRVNQTGGFKLAAESSPERRNCLEFPCETRLSVVNGTRGLRSRDDGDDA